MRSNQHSKKLICLLLVLVLTVQLLPANVFAETVAAGKHSGMLVEFDSPEHAQAFVAQKGGRQISDRFVQMSDSVFAQASREEAGIVSSCYNGYLEAESYDDDPNDTLYADQWAMQAVNARKSWARGVLALQDEDLPPALVQVAVLDTGIDGTHPDLIGRVGDGYDVVTEEVLPGDTDSDCSSDSHGTMVAGIIAATAYNGMGIAGVAGEYPVTVLPVRVLNENGNGTIADVVAGIYWAIDNGADVINMSFSKRLSYYPSPLAQAVTDAVDAGILVFTASGNDGRSDITDCYPACLPGIHPVAAYERNDDSYRLCSFSNGSYYRISNGFYCAPGRDVLTTVKGGDYDFFTGTSAACAFISGFAAFVSSVDSAGGMRNPSNVETIINKCVVSSGWYDKILNMDRVSRYDFGIWTDTENNPQFTLFAPEVAFGEEDVSIQITKGADLISDVAFVCRTDEGFQTVFLQNDGSDPNEYSAQMDFSACADGTYQLYACLNLKQYEYRENWWQWYDSSSLPHRSSLVTVQHPGQSSLLHLMDPTGCSIGEQDIYVLDPDSGETLKKLTTNKNGYVQIPAACFRNGEAVIACDTTEFFYRQTIHQAAQIELGGTQPPMRTLKVLDREGEGVADAKLYLIQKNTAFPIGETGKDGILTLAADDGMYTFAAVCGNGYDLPEGTIRAILMTDVSFDEETNEVCFDLNAELCQLSIPELPSEHIQDADLELISGDMSFYLNELHGEPIYITPGQWDIELNYNYLVESYSYTEELTYSLKDQHLSAGETTLAVDPTHLSLRLDWRSETVRPNSTFDYDLYLEDRLGNRVSGYLDVDTTVYGGEMDGKTFEFDMPSIYNFPTKDCDYIMDVQLRNIVLDSYSGVTFDVTTVRVEFSYRMGKTITVNYPVGHSCYASIQIYAQKSDGSTVQLDPLNYDNIYDAQDLEFGTPISVIAQSWCGCNTDSYHYVIWTWGGSYTKEKEKIVLTDNAVRCIHPELLNAPDDMWAYVTFDFEVNGMKLYSNEYDLSGLESGLWIPADAASYCGSAQCWDAEQECSVAYIWNDDIPAGEEADMPAWDFDREWTTGFYNVQGGANLQVEFPNGSMTSVNAYNEDYFLNTSSEDVSVTAKFIVSSNRENTTFVRELTFPTEGAAPLETTLHPLSSITLFTPGELTAGEHAVLGVYLMDTEGYRYTAIGSIPNGGEVIEESNEILYHPTVYYRRQGETNWTKVTDGSMTKVDLGLLPEGDYEAKAEFDLTGFKMSEYDGYPQGKYDVLVTGPVTEFTVGGGSGCKVSAFAETYGDMVRVILTGTPGAEAKIFASMAGEGEEQVGTCVLSDEGLGKVLFSPKQGGTLEIYAQAELDGQTVCSTRITLDVAERIPAPIALNADGAQPGSVLLQCKWAARNGLSAVLFREGIELARFTESPAQYTDSGLKTGRIYTYSLVLETSDGERGEMLYTSARPTMEADHQAPTVPGNFAANAHGSYVTLSWGRSEDNDRVKAYIIYRDGEELTRLVSRSYTDSGLSLGKTYSYAVAAIDPSGNLSAQTEVQTVETSGVVSIDDISWQSAHMIGDVIASNTIRINVKAQSGLEDVRAEVHYLDPNGAEQSTLLALKPYGQYYSDVLMLNNVAHIENVDVGIYLNGTAAARQTQEIDADCIVRSFTVTLVGEDWEAVPTSLRRDVELTINSKSAGISYNFNMRSPSLQLSDLIPAQDYVLELYWNGAMVAREQNVRLQPGANQEFEFTNHGLNVLKVNVIHWTGMENVPLTDDVYVNNRRYTCDSNGRLQSYAGETAILIPRSEPVLHFRAVDQFKLDGSGYTFLDDVVLSDLDEVTVYAEPVPVALQSITAKDNQGMPIVGMKLLITQETSEGKYYETVTTNTSGKASFNIMPDTYYKAEPLEEYSFLKCDDPTAEKDGKLIRVFAMEGSEEAVVEGFGWLCNGSLSLTLSPLPERFPLQIHLTDAFGRPVPDAVLRIYPMGVTGQHTAQTDENGMAEFHLAQTDSYYSVVIEEPREIRNQAIQDTTKYIYESERAAGIVEWEMKQTFAPKLDGLKTGESALLYMYGGPIREPYFRMANSGRQYTNYRLPGEDSQNVGYCLIPVKGAGWAQLGQNNSEWTPEAMKAIGAMSGYVDAENGEMITAQSDVCTLTLDPQLPENEELKTVLNYEFCSNGKTVLTVRAREEITVRLRPGASFTLNVYSDDFEYACTDMKVDVPKRTAATVTIPMEIRYAIVCLTDENGVEHPELSRSWIVYDEDMQLVCKSDCKGDFHIARRTNTAGKHIMFVRFGSDTVLQHTYMNLEESGEWTRVVIDEEPRFEGQTIKIAIPLPPVDAPTVSLSTSYLIGHSETLLKDFSIRSLTKETSLVTFKSRRLKDFEGIELVLPKEASEVKGLDSQDRVQNVEFKIPTSVLVAGTNVRVEANGKVLKQVNLSSDPFEAYTQNALSSSEITFCKVEENKPLIPEHGYFRNMPKDAPLLQASYTSMAQSVRTLDKSYFFYTTTQRDFEISVNIDGIPVNYRYDDVVTMQGGQTVATYFHSITTPGYEESTGRIWQNTFQLDRMGIFNKDSGEGWLMLPYPEPESYPHTYEVNAMLRFADESEPSGWHYETRTENVTVYADTAYLRSYEYTHYDSETIGRIEEEISPTYWIRPKTEEELNDYHNVKRYSLNWNNTNLFTFRADFAKPEEVAYAWAVADVPGNCAYRSFQLHYNEETGCWSGTGKLGDSFCIPDGFCVNYVLKSAVAGGDYPAISIKDLTAAMDYSDIELPSGWTAELTDPREMTLEDCLAMWDDYTEKVGTLRGDALEAYLTDFFGEDRIAPMPALKITDEEGKEAVFYSSYELDPVMPDSNTGRRYGVQLEDGSIVPLCVVSEQEENRISRDIYGDMSLLMPDAAADQMSTSALSWFGAIARGVRWGCEIVSGGLDIYTKASTIVDGDAALFDNVDDWAKDLPPDALAEYQDWQDKKFMNDLLDLGLGALSSLLPISLVATTAFDVWLFKKTNEVDDIYKEIARRNRKYKEMQARWKRTHPIDLDPRIQTYIDPSGFIFEAVEDNRLEGVSATVMTKVNEQWITWDSESYGEGPNPQISTEDGSYGWNVSKGKWKVLFEKEGYAPTESAELDVPPAHTDVNVGMVSLDAPVLTSTVPAVGGEIVDFTFSRYMRTADVLSAAVLVYEGEEMPASLTAVDASYTTAGNKQAEYPSAPAAGLSVAKTFRFTLEDPMPEGASCFIRLKTDCRAYNGKLIAAGDGTFAVVPAIPEYRTAEVLEFAEDGYAMPTSGSLNLAAELNCDGEDYLSRVTWESMSPDAFVVDADGTVTTLKGGTGYIRASCDGLMAICAVADYERAERLTVCAVDTLTGEMAAKETAYWFEAGTSYSIEAPTVPGMNAETAVLSGVMSSGDQTLTLNYTPATAVYALSDDPNGALRLAFRDGMSGTVSLMIAGYDVNGRMLWTDTEAVTSPTVGQIVSIELPAQTAKSIRLFVTDENAIPLTLPLELNR